jgi:hypothetical protein
MHEYLDELIINVSQFFVTIIVFKFYNSNKNVEPEPHSKSIPQSIIDDFIYQGYVVIPNVLSQDEVEHARNEFHQSLLKYGVC